MPGRRETVELLQKLLILHYREGGLPKALMEQVEEILKGLGEWFPDPRLFVVRLI